MGTEISMIQVDPAVFKKFHLAACNSVDTPVCKNLQTLGQNYFRFLPHVPSDGQHRWCVHTITERSGTENSG